MSIRLMSIVWDLDLPPGEKLVLLALADQANDEGRQCWPSVATIMKRSGQGERTVRRAIADLETKGHLTRHMRDGTSTQYHVHPCQIGTPAETAPLPNATPTPAKLAPKPSRTTNTSEAKASSDRRAKPSTENWHRLPEDWEPTKPLPTELAAKVAQWPPGKIENELNALRDWAANAKNENGKGRKLDWDKAWQGWLRRADEDWRQRNGPGSRSVQQVAPDGRRMGRTEAASRSAYEKLAASGNFRVGGQAGPALAGGNHGGPLTLPDPDSPHRHDARRSG